MGMQKQWIGIVILITISIMAALLLVPAIHAEPQNQYGYMGNGLTDALNKDNFTGWNASHQVEYHATLQPVTLFRAELNETSLPGPRYMAFGPSVISLSIDPIFLVILITLVVLSIVVWYVIRHKRDDEGEE
jgi:flagellar basal body-associated protein FliL